MRDHVFTTPFGTLPFPHRTSDGRGEGRITFYPISPGLCARDFDIYALKRPHSQRPVKPNITTMENLWRTVSDLGFHRDLHNSSEKASLIVRIA